MTERAKMAMDFLLWLKYCLSDEQFAKCEKLIKSHRIKSFYKEVARLEERRVI